MGSLLSIKAENRGPIFSYYLHRCQINQKSLQQPLKCSPYFKKVSPWSQIRDFWAILQYTDIQTVDVVGQNIGPEIR